MTNHTLRFSESLGDKTPRPYQTENVAQVSAHLAAGVRRVLVKQPTGCGKTFTAKMVTLCEQAREALGVTDRPLRVLFLAGMRRLNRQAFEEFEGLTSVEVILQSTFSDIPQDIVDKGWDLAIYDECHHEAMLSFQMLLEKLSVAPMIGFTADDDRGDKLLCKFEAVVQSITEEQAAEAGYIKKAGINTVIDTGGQSKIELATSLLENYHEHMGNTIAFFQTNREACQFHEHALALGLTSEVITSHTTDAELDDILDQLSCGDIQFVANCQRIGEGVDAKNITDVLLARQFGSSAEKRQYVGRAIRPDSPCAVWEFQNPLIDSVDTKSVVGGVKYHRLLWVLDDVWHENLLEGDDPTWGQMRALRTNPDAVEAIEAGDGRAPTIHGEGQLSARAMGVNANERDEETIQREARAQRNENRPVISLDKSRARFRDGTLVAGQSETAIMERRRGGEKVRREVQVVNRKARRIAA